jgi:galactokinase
MVADREGLVIAFRRVFKRPPQVVAEAPGRVNLIGEHTDYNRGYVLPVAIDRTVVALASGSDAPVLRSFAADVDECDEAPIDGLAPVAGGGWRNYVRGAAWALAAAGYSRAGADLAFGGDVPIGAGLSSSAALLVAVTAVLTRVVGVILTPVQIADLARRAENEFVGVQTGIMDQLTAATATAGHALLIDCKTLAADSVPIPDPREMAILVVDSGVSRTLSETAYNDRRRECEQAAALLGVASLRECTLEALEHRRAEMPPHLYRRARHVITENQRVLEAADAFRNRDLERVGKLLYRSHESLRDDFEVSTPELDLLVDLARQADGVIGARLTGAGFGGAAVLLVRPDSGHRRLVLPRRVIAHYERETGRKVRALVCRAAGGLRVSDA